MSFIKLIASKAAAKPTTIKAVDPINAYTAAALDQVKQLKAGAIKGRWFRVRPDRSVLLSFRNGVKIMPVTKTGFIIEPDVESAIATLLASIEAAKAGEFDEIFKAQARK